MALSKAGASTDSSPVADRGGTPMHEGAGVVLVAF